MNKNIHGSKRGATLVLFAIVIVALICIMALVIDIGRLYVAKQRAQNVVDAAAIGGGSKLDVSEEAAQIEAHSIIDENNSEMPKWFVNDVLISFPTTITKANGKTITVPAGNALRVHGKVNVDFAFAPIFKIFGNTDCDSGKAGATAIVVREAATHIYGSPVPWAMRKSAVWGDPPYVAGQPKNLVIHQKEGELGPGNFGAIYYPPDDARDATYTKRLAGKQNNSIDLALLDTVGNLHGSVISNDATINGLKERFPNSREMTREEIEAEGIIWDSKTSWYDAGMTFDEWQAGGMKSCPQLVILPIVDDPAVPQEFKVAGFAAYFITYFGETKGSNKQAIVRGHFVSGVIKNGIIDWDVAIPDSSSTTLLEEVHLVK